VPEVKCKRANSINARHRVGACLVHFAFLQNFTVAKESYQFEVLNEVYLQNFLHGWVVNHETNLMMLINP
jgi:hypothetical protein